MQRESQKLAEVNQALQKAEQQVELVRMEYQKRIIDEELKRNRETQEKERKSRESFAKEMN